MHYLSLHWTEEAEGAAPQTHWGHGGNPTSTAVGVAGAQGVPGWARPQFAFGLTAEVSHVGLQAP